MNFTAEEYSKKQLRVDNESMGMQSSQMGSHFLIIFWETSSLGVAASQYGGKAPHNSLTNCYIYLLLRLDNMSMNTSEMNKTGTHFKRKEKKLRHLEHDPG